MTRFSMALIAANVALLGLGAAAVSYVATALLGPPITEYVAFQAMNPLVRRGGSVTIEATYAKRSNCGGLATVSIDSVEDAEAPRILRSIILGDRPPGTFSLSRSFQIPADMPLGAATLQETLAYYCGLRSQVIRSPVMSLLVEK